MPSGDVRGDRPFLSVFGAIAQTATPSFAHAGDQSDETDSGSIQPI